MKLEVGRMYLKKEVKTSIKGNDCHMLVKQDGKHLDNFLSRIDDNDELYLKRIIETECIDPFTGHQGKCKIYVFEVPTEVYEKAMSKKLTRIRRAN